MLKKRKRPGVKHQKHLLIQKPFGGAFIKKMLIPRAMDSYNYNINAGDVADQ